MQLGDSVPVQLMQKDKTGSLEEVSVRRVSLPPLSVVVVECAVWKELMTLSLNRLITLLKGCSHRVLPINLENLV